MVIFAGPVRILSRSNWPGDSCLSRATGEAAGLWKSGNCCSSTACHQHEKYWTTPLQNSGGSGCYQDMSEQIKSHAVLYSSLKYMYVDHYFPWRKHPCIQAVSGMRDVPRVSVKAKLLTGTYILQVNRVAFNQNEVSPLCLLCHENDETTEHFLLQCPVLSCVRQPLLTRVVELYTGLFQEQPNSPSLLQFILDGCAVFQFDNQRLFHI